MSLGKQDQTATSVLQEERARTVCNVMTITTAPTALSTVRKFQDVIPALTKELKSVRNNGPEPTAVSAQQNTMEQAALFTASQRSTTTALKLVRRFVHQEALHSLEAAVNQALHLN